MTGNGAVAAAIHDPEHVVFRDLLHEANATRAKNAALGVEGDARPEFYGFRLLDLVLEKARGGVAVLDRKLLQPALAGLIADRAIERMIDEQELHHPLPAFLRHRGVRAHGHPLGDVLGAGDLGAREPRDLGPAVRAEDRFAIRAQPGRAHFDEAHPAVAGGGKPRVIAIARDKLARLQTRLDEPRPFREGHPDAIDLHVDHRSLGWRGVAHRSLFPSYSCSCSCSDPTSPSGSSPSRINFS